MERKNPWKLYNSPLVHQPNEVNKQTPYNTDKKLQELLQQQKQKYHDTNGTYNKSIYKKYCNCGSTTYDPDDNRYFDSTHSILSFEED